MDSVPIDAVRWCNGCFSSGKERIGSAIDGLSADLTYDSLEKGEKAIEEMRGRTSIQVENFNH